ncbi:MAG: GNAT family N-acetyltransferase [Acidimicrobiales bacterium]
MASRADLAGLWVAALTALRHQRGGASLARDLAAGRSDRDWLDEAVARANLWHVGDAAIALVDASTILGLYVVPDRRRHGVARTLVAALREAHPSVRDALVLPGDRASKSLYESLGWRARLLTMAEPS